MFSSLKILHHNENTRFSQGGNSERPGYPMKISLTVAYCQRPFLFRHHRLLHYMLFFSKDDCHLRGKISLPLSGELPYWGGGKGFLTTSDLQVPFWLQKLLSQTGLCSEKLFLILFTYKLKVISSRFCHLRGPISGWLAYSEVQLCSYWWMFKSWKFINGEVSTLVSLFFLGRDEKRQQRES